MKPIELGGRLGRWSSGRGPLPVLLAARLRRLIDEGRLTTVFQPIWSLAAESLLGVEALTRPDPSYGLSGPAEAFDIAEELGRVHELDITVDEALKYIISMGVVAPRPHAVAETPAIGAQATQALRN